MVHLATREKDGAHFAAKILNANDPSSSRELRIYSQLELHRNIVQLIDIGCVEGHKAYIFELCGGGELFNFLIERGTLPVDTIQDLFRQLCFGLHSAHDHGVAHRDLKLENILMSKDLLTVKIADFGLATAAPSEADPWSCETACGSLAYAAPEITTRSYDPFKADVWSLGVCLVCLLYSRHPFDCAAANSKHYTRYIADLQGGRPTVLDVLGDKRPECAQGLDVAKMCLQPDPTDRPSLAQLLELPWVSPSDAGSTSEPAAAALSGSSEPSVRHLGWLIKHGREEDDAAFVHLRAQFVEALEASGFEFWEVDRGRFAVGAQKEVQVAVSIDQSTSQVQWFRNKASPFEYQEIYQGVRARFEELRGEVLATNFSTSASDEVPKKYQRVD